MQRAVLLTALAVTGCGPISTLSPGETTAAQLPDRQLPDGARYSFAIDYDLAPRSASNDFTVQVDFVSRRVSADRFRHSGVWSASLHGNEQSQDDSLEHLETLGGGSPEVSEGVARTYADFVTDRRGRALSRSIFGFENLFRPHDCFATIGECHYQELFPEGGASSIVAMTTEADGVWNTEIRSTPGSGGVNATMTYTLDENGFVKDLDLISNELLGENRVYLRRLNRKLQ